MSLIVLAQIEAKPESLALVQVALEKMLSPTRAEQGCISYVLHQDMDHDNKFVMIEEWENAAALELHFNTPHMNQLKTEIADHILNLQIQKVRRV